jgi:methylisocitrate lyase
MQDAKEFEQFRKAVNVPLLANITEFGKTPLLTAKQLGDIGYNIMIFPVTSLRLAMGAVRAGMAEIAATGTQAGALGKMLTRKELYELIRYEDYNRFDQSVFNFKL